MHTSVRRNAVIAVSILTLLGVVACRGQAECAQASDCSDGYTCVDKTCKRSCLVQSNCNDVEVCYGGVCTARTGAALPEIATVVGNAANNPERVADGLMVNGRLLGRATFELRDGAHTVPLTIRNQSESQAEVILPTDVRRGLHTLAATNVSGTTESTVTLELPDLSGDLLVDRINTQATIKLALGVMPDELVALQMQNQVLAARLTALEDKSCPSGYVHDTTSTEIVLCKKGADEIVKVGDFWVDRYESSVWQNSDCSGVQYGTSGDDYPVGFPHNGNIGNTAAKLYACSKVGVTPSRSLTWFQAQQACVASGKHLMTNGEWQAAAAGTVDPGSSDGTDGKCNTIGAGPRLTGSAGSTPAGNTSCVSLYGAEDMVGNLWEWTADWYQAGEPYNGTPTNWIDVTVDTTHWPDTTYGNDGSWNVAGRASNSAGAIPVNGLLAAGIRGGAWNDGTNAGVFAVAVNGGPSVYGQSLGLRCARR